MAPRLWLATGTCVALGALLVAVAAAQNQPEVRGSAVAEHMHQHLSAMRAMKAFIIAGQLDDNLREAAVWVEEHEATPGLPGDWQPYILQMRRYAGQVADARHLDFAAVSVGEMAGVCGDCHSANGVEVGFGDYTSAPGASPNVRVQMRRHLWAVDRMWEGLISPSDSAWRLGAETLADVQVNAADIGATGAQQPKVDYLLARAREIGTEGASVESPKARGALYGELLSLCADCHNMTGGGPGT